MFVVQSARLLKARKAGCLFCFCFFFTDNDSCQTNYLKICLTDLCEILKAGRTTAVEINLKLVL